MTAVIWAPQAIQDVEAIRAHVGRDSPHYADLLVERLIAAVERLTDNPRSGRVVPELGDESIREVIAFPKTQKGTCPLTDAPAPVDARQLRDLGISVVEGAGPA